MKPFPATHLHRRFGRTTVTAGMDEKRPSVVLIDDHAFMRESQKRAIESDARLRFAGQAAAGRQGIALIRAVRPDLAVVDIELEDIDGWDVLDAVLSEGLSSRIVFMSGHGDADSLDRALRHNAAGFISKRVESDDFCELLVRAGTGKRAISADLQAAYFEQVGRVSGAPLSPRELDVLRCIASGRNAGQIGLVLGLSASTVKTHTESLRRKLKATNSPNAVAEGFRRGLID